MGAITTEEFCLTPATRDLSPAELRLELACALYARGRMGKASGAEFAGVDFFAFQHALSERAIESYTPAMLDEDMIALRRLFPV